MKLELSVLFASMTLLAASAFAQSPAFPAELEAGRYAGRM